jgi:pantoate--beta-alanine ligase
MIVRTTIEAFRAERARLGPVAFVPTMGALHEGHLSLIRRARELADHVVVSVFVNPTQFGPHEDLEAYPRPIEHDLARCRDEGVDLVFNPSVEQMYPVDQPAVVVDVPAMTTILEGARRPGHFVGVCRVVAKLFDIVQPRLACFGRKDYQQLKVIEAMTRGLCMPIEIVGCRTIRDADGLALSSRNAYLDAAQRRRALGLSSAVREGVRLIADGEVDPAVVEEAMRQVMAAYDVATEYAVVRHPDTLGELDVIGAPGDTAVCLVAGKVGDVRLIDNMSAATGAADG